MTTTNARDMWLESSRHHSALIRAQQPGERVVVRIVLDMDTDPSGFSDFAVARLRRMYPNADVAATVHDRNMHDAAIFVRQGDDSEVFQDCDRSDGLRWLLWNDWQSEFEGSGTAAVEAV